MCGIYGFVAASGDLGDPVRTKRVLAAMDRAIIHRGPDDSGTYVDARCVLGVRRLAIIDLEGGRQPIPNEDHTVWVVLNGEIYNYRALAHDLAARSHHFATRSDTEVLVHLYEEHGLGLVERLIGMFSFAIWDERQERLVLARDRLGIKPLYWFDDGERVAFASEIKALLPLLRNVEVDPVALRHYLTFVAVPPPRTLFAGVSKLAPATLMVFDRDGPPSATRYWDPLRNRARDVRADAWEERFRAGLERSIERRMMSDVPVGVFLSGGVDSSTNVALMSGLVDEPVNTFSVGFADHSRYTEFEWARRVANRFRTRHREITLEADDLWPTMSSLVHHQDEPIADPVCLPLYFLAKLAKESGVTVVHVGEGADELLAGYPTYVKAESVATGIWRWLRSLPGPLRAGLGRVGASALSRVPSREIEAAALDRLTQTDGHLWWGGAIAFYERGLNRLTTPILRKEATGEEPREIVAAIAADADAAGEVDELGRIIYQDLRLRLPELLLMRVDKLTMAHSVEARVPFLDHELVELAMAMPSEEKVRDGIGKRVLKRAMADLLERDILWRPKQGFGAPVEDWFRRELADDLARRLEHSEIHSLGYLDRTRISDLLDLHRSGRADRSFQLWNLLNLCAWFDYWVAGSSQPEIADPAFATG
jgi:asparagine synthase (glutamine-hydrolysing)